MDMHGLMVFVVLLEHSVKMILGIYNPKFQSALLYWLVLSKYD